MSKNFKSKQYGVFFASDAKKFYEAKKGTLLEQTELETKLLLAGVEPKDLSMELLSIVQEGRPYNDHMSKKEPKIKLGKKEDIKLRLDVAYVDLKPLIPFIFYNKAEGTTFAFKRLNPNEVATINTNDAKALVSSLYSDATIMQQFNEYYTSSVILNSTMTFDVFLEEISKRAKSDTTNFITEEPKFITWKEEQLAFKYFNPDILVDAPTPYYNDFCDRLGQGKEIFMAWVWSIFEPENNCRQMLWIKGEGKEGKSTVFNALSAFIGKHHSASVSETDLKSPFFFNSIYGRILVTYPDCHITDIFREEKLKNITGGDEQTINGKFAQTFKGSVYSKVLIGSNQFPQVAWHVSNQSSRIIVLEIQSLSEEKMRQGDSGALPGLIKETPAFLKKCRSLYKKYFPTNSSLVLPKEYEKYMHSTFISNEMAVLREFCNERLELGSSYTCKSSAVRGELSLYFKGNELKKPNDLDNMFEKYVKSLATFIQGPVQVPYGSSTTIGFKGFKLKDPNPIQTIKKGE